MLLPIVLLTIAFGLLFLEFFIPSAGLVGISAGIAFVAAIVTAFMHSIALGAIFLFISAIGAPCVLMIAVKIYPHTPLGKRMMLDPPEEVLPEKSDKNELIGRHGIARSKMLPSGSVKIDGKIYDAISDGMAVDSGDKVEVVAIRNNGIVVRPILESKVIEESDNPLSQSAEQFGIDDFDFKS